YSGNSWRPRITQRDSAATGCFARGLHRLPQVLTAEDLSPRSTPNNLNLEGHVPRRSCERRLGRVRTFGRSEASWRLQQAPPTFSFFGVILRVCGYLFSASSAPPA